MAAPYLIENPPARSQFRAVRRAPVSGAVVVHTAENMLDAIPPDDGAENVARFIRGRADPGSYHTVVDSDSIVRLVPFSHEAWGARVGNAWALHLSFACRAADWPTMGLAQHDAMIANGAKAAAEMARWCEDKHGITVPDWTLTAASYRAGAAGFISHGRVDPEHRTDPGAQFPWVQFLNAYAREMRPTMTIAPKHTIADFGAVAETISQLYSAYRDGEQPQQEMGYWQRRVAQKLASGTDILEDLEFLQWALANPSLAAALNG